MAQFLVLFPFANDSFHFSSEIFELDSNLFMRSLHVDSLFTKIPLTKTIKTFNEIEFRQLLQFNETVHMQVDMVAM